jgi:hypothetical protein
MEVVENFTPTQIGHISKYHLESITQMPKYLMIPMHLLQWLAFRSAMNRGWEFVKRDKVIHFNKQIVDKIFGFPSGTITFAMGSNDPGIKAEVKALRMQYHVGKKYPVHRLESILLETDDEMVFIRTLILYFIITVLCPPTSNFFNSKLLFSPRDINMPQVGQLDFATLCLDHLFEELDDWFDRVFNQGKNPNRLLWIGGCLPVLAVSCFYVRSLFF